MENNIVNEFMNIKYKLGINTKLSNQKMLERYEEIKRNIGLKNYYKIYLKSLCCEMCNPVDDKKLVCSSLFKLDESIDDIDIREGDYFEVVRLADSKTQKKDFFEKLTDTNFHMCLVIIRERDGIISWNSLGFSNLGWTSPDIYLVKFCEKLMKEENFVLESNLNRRVFKKHLKTFIKNKFKKNRVKNTNGRNRWSINEDIVSQNVLDKNTDLIDVVGVGRFTKDQIKRLKNKMKFQSGNMKSFVYQRKKIAKSKFLTYGLNDMEHLRFEEANNLKDPLLGKLKQQYNAFSERKNTFTLFQNKKLYDIYTDNCTSSLLEIFPKIIKHPPFLFITPILVEPNIPKKNNMNPSNIDYKLKFLSNSFNKKPCYIKNKNIKNDYPNVSANLKQQYSVLYTATKKNKLLQNFYTENDDLDNMMDSINDILLNDRKNNDEKQNIIYDKTKKLMKKLKARNDADPKLVESVEIFLKIIEKTKQNKLDQQIYNKMRLFMRIYYVIFDLIIYLHKYYGINKYDDTLYSYLNMINDIVGKFLAKKNIRNINSFISELKNFFGSLYNIKFNPTIIYTNQAKGINETLKKHIKYVLDELDKISNLTNVQNSVNKRFLKKVTYTKNNGSIIEENIINQNKLKEKLVEHLLMLNDELMLVSKSKVMNITLWIQIDKIKAVVKKILKNPNINKQTIRNSGLINVLNAVNKKIMTNKKINMSNAKTYLQKAERLLHRYKLV